MTGPQYFREVREYSREAMAVIDQAIKYLDINGAEEKRIKDEIRHRDDVR